MDVFELTDKELVVLSTTLLASSSSSVVLSEHFDFSDAQDFADIALDARTSPVSVFPISLEATTEIFELLDLADVLDLTDAVLDALCSTLLIISESSDFFDLTEIEDKALSVLASFSSLTGSSGPDLPEASDFNDLELGALSAFCLSGSSMIISETFDVLDLTEERDFADEALGALSWISKSFVISFSSCVASDITEIALEDLSMF